MSWKPCAAALLPAGRGAGTVVLPCPIYRGPFLRAEGGGAGVRALRTPDYGLDVGASASFGSGNEDIEARRGMPRIGTLVRREQGLSAGIGLSYTIASSGEPGAP